MKRRNFIGTLAAAISAAGIGIAVSTPKGQLELFAKFFEKRNDFPMNGFQIAAYIAYEKGQRFYFPPKQGMTTLFHTIASYEWCEHNKSVLFVAEKYLMEYRDDDFKVCFWYNKESFLCGKSYDVILCDIKEDRDFTSGISSVIRDVYPLCYSAGTVTSRVGVLKKRFPNFNV